MSIFVIAIMALALVVLLPISIAGDARGTGGGFAVSLLATLLFSGVLILGALAST